ncbi:MAG: hypothetical protein ACRD2W_16850 [Acidimicrobiales bacterium]
MSHPDRWYQHVPAATAVISCEGQSHRLTWRWGKLKLDDHDLGSERAMLVLGGVPCPCLRALGLWANLFDMRPEQLGQMRKHMGEESALIPDEFDVPRDVGLLLNLERAWKKSRYLDKQGRLLERQVKDRALPAFRAHLTAEKQRFGSRLIRTALVKHVAAVHPARVEGRMDSVSVSATVTLSSSWVVNVWSRGLAVVDGTFIIDASGPAGSAGSVDVRAIRWRPHDREPSVAEPVIAAAKAVRSGDEWHLVE